MERDILIEERTKTKILIRPKVFLSTKLNENLKEDMNKEKIFELIKAQNNEKFKENLTELISMRNINFKKFYTKLNEMLRYKWRGAIVKKNFYNNNKLSYVESMTKVTDYHKKIFVKVKTTPEPLPFNNIFNFSIDIDGAWAKLAKNKTICWDKILAEWIIKAMEDEKFKLKIRNYFQKWVIDLKVPEFWMKWKIILLNKDKGISPTAESTIPITILPPILKLFELSIIHNFEKVIYEERNLNWNQRGFIKHKVTEDNIRDVLNFCYEKKITKIKKETSFLIFINFQKAYDTANDESVTVFQLEEDEEEKKEENENWN